MDDRPTIALLLAWGRLRRAVMASINRVVSPLTPRSIHPRSIDRRTSERSWGPRGDSDPRYRTSAHGWLQPPRHVPGLGMNDFRFPVPPPPFFFSYTGPNIPLSHRERKTSSRTKLVVRGRGPAANKKSRKRRSLVTLLSVRGKGGKRQLSV